MDEERAGRGINEGGINKLIPNTCSKNTHTQINERAHWDMIRINCHEGLSIPLRPKNCQSGSSRAEGDRNPFINLPLHKDININDNENIEKRIL